jgi:AcrR family transcriptional regulator
VTTTTRASEPRERLLRTAAALFYREGITGVGVDRVLAEAGVPRATMYRHFPGKEALVVAYLELEDATIRGYFAEAAAAGGSPQELLAAVVDGVADDARRYHDRGCPFINASAEYADPESPVRAVVRRHRDWFRATLTDLAAAAGLTDPAATAASLVLLRDAALVGVYLDGEAAALSFHETAHRLVQTALTG